MSLLFTNNLLGQLRHFRFSDERASEQRATFHARTQAQQDFAPGVLWSRPSFMGSAVNILGLDGSNTTGDYEALWETAGNAGRKKLTGITRDSTGAALGTVSVQAIRADGSQKDGSVTSDASGYYEIAVANPTGNYKIDAYKAGSPDVAGTTVNTLTPV